MNILDWLQGTPMAAWVLTSNYGYYISLAGHAVGMAVVAGTMVIVSLRVLGFSPQAPMSMFDRLFKIAWAGFALNFVTGAMLFASNGRNLSENTAFLIKIALIVIGGVAVFLLWRAVKADDGLAGARTASGRTKALAALTLACWTGAIVAGRIIGYTIDY